MSAAAAVKLAAARAAVAEIEPGMVVGLGTGTTAAVAIELIGRRVAAGLRLSAVATSEASARAARAAGIALVDLSARASVDLAIDGVDEIDDALRAIKGGGGAMLREKIVAAAAERMVAIADGSKAVPVLGGRPVPVEVLPFATAAVADALERLGCTATLRRDTAGDPARTDQGNSVLDCAFGGIDDPAQLAAAIDAVPGALGHGLFPTEIDALYLAAAPDQVVRRERNGATHVLPATSGSRPEGE